MGTRSLTKVFDEQGDMVVNMYRQFDGYPSGHGKELHAFLDDRDIVNGFNPGMDGKKVSNGMSDLAAQLAWWFKQDSLLGGIYLEPTKHGDHGQDYEYHIRITAQLLQVTVYRGEYRSGKKPLFQGDVDDFGAFCAKEE